MKEENFTKEYEKKVIKIINILRVADCDMLYHALKTAPDKNLRHMMSIIQNILHERHCGDCDAEKHTH